ncbi:uncharacterized protein KGF55_000781 [Candida pseudojiufengensis]|uniref:uncharacterized protein n=1 Tax=Candida pseudojiufengensis TaxID=497109 RepID=UPI0022245E47|nr:uncharacterized protein KGF55_000781 [Candida pseudojiufengensis]KAI5966472.1 hypothetical protein KGF55_000781 [Candida pseudojiufengensis]
MAFNNTSFKFDQFNPSIQYHNQHNQQQQYQQSASTSTSNLSSFDDEDIFEINMEEDDNILNNNLNEEQNYNNYTTLSNKHSSISSISSTSPIISSKQYSNLESSIISPILSPTNSSYYNNYSRSFEEEEDGDHLLYECIICKKKMDSLSSELHNCTKNLYSTSSNNTDLTINDENFKNENDFIIKNNNELIQNNYRKWLFKITPSFPY